MTNPEYRTPPVPAMKPRNLAELATQNISADYNERSTSPIYSDWQQGIMSGLYPATTRHIAVTNAAMKDDLAQMLDPDFKVVRHHMTGDKKLVGELLMAVNDRTSMLVERNLAAIDVQVASATIAEARKALLDVVARIPHSDTPSDVVDTWIWHLSSVGPNSRLKKLHVPSWSDIEDNYVPEVGGELDKIMKMVKPASRGKIILWHGAPGVGKTTAVRALAREWKNWCGLHYVSDPERFFANPNYLMEVGTTRDDDSDGVDLEDLDVEDILAGNGRPRPSWRLVVAEDSDEFLRENARDTAGAALGRLLNFSDGILGQGSNTVVLLTTNEPIEKLHKAVIRPGRCLAQVEFREFSPAAAARWFKVNGVSHTPTENMSLAQMIEKRDGVTPQIATGLADEAVGQYL